MSLKIYNTLKAKKEEFKPLQAGKVGMYVCGVTVYGPCHLGHARAAITFDVIARYLRQLNYEVSYICNYTDVDDKIINLAIREGVESEVIAKRYIREYETDMEALHVQLPDMLPKATEHIDDMIAMIETFYPYHALFLYF